MDEQVRVDTRRLFGVIALWAGVVAAAAAGGVYRAIPPMSVGPLILAGVIIPFIVYRRSARFQAVIAAIGLRRLTAFHSWRIIAGVMFLWFMAQDQLPPLFARNAGWGDILAGLLAIVVVMLPLTRGRYVAFHIFGLLDLVDALLLGITFTLAADPRIVAIRELPMALIPLFGVGVTGASHLIAFDLLWRQARATARPALT